LERVVVALAVLPRQLWAARVDNKLVAPEFLVLDLIQKVISAIDQLEAREAIKEVVVHTVVS
jgi:hypothetical protein